MVSVRCIMPGQGDGQGASAIDMVGIEAVMRKGCAGKIHEHTPLPKPAALRTIQDGFIGNASNVDLIVRRQTRPDHEVLRRTSAGSLSPERRRVDLPSVILESSIEHTAHRRHAVPPTSISREASPHNFIVAAAQVEVSAECIGRSLRGRPRSPQPRALNATSSGPPSPRTASSISPFVQPRDEVSLAPIVSQLNRSGSEIFSDARCSWGASLAFAPAARDHGEPSQRSSHTNDVASLPMNKVVAPSFADAVSDSVEASKMGVVQRWISSGNDAGKCTPVGSTGALSPTTPSTFFTDTILSDCTNLCSSSVKVTFARNVDKRFRQAYERRVKAMVQAEQKKAMKKVDK